MNCFTKNMNKESIVSNFLKLWLNCESKLSWKMKFLVFKSNSFAFAILALIILSGCGSHVNKGQIEDTSYTFKPADTIGDAKTIVDKANALLANNKMEEASGFIAVNMHRFNGKEKAMLLNVRGDTYFMKDDYDKAVTDYLAASDMDPENPLYMINVAKTYECLDNRYNATIFDQKILALKTASDSDRVFAQDMIAKFDRAHNAR